MADHDDAESGTVFHTPDTISTADLFDRFDGLKALVSSLYESTVDDVESALTAKEGNQEQG
jgi:hypothetical protein